MKLIFHNIFPEGSLTYQFVLIIFAEIMPFPALISDEDEQDGDIAIRITDAMLLMISNSPVILGSGKFGTVVLGTVTYEDERKDEKAAVKMLKSKFPSF